METIKVKTTDLFSALCHNLESYEKLYESANKVYEELKEKIRSEYFAKDAQKDIDKFSNQLKEIFNKDNLIGYISLYLSCNDQLNELNKLKPIDLSQEIKDDIQRIKFCCEDEIELDMEDFNAMVLNKRSVLQSEICKAKSISQFYCGSIGVSGATGPIGSPGVSGAIGDLSETLKTYN